MEQNRKPDVERMTALLEEHKFKQLKDEQKAEDPCVPPSGKRRGRRGFYRYEQ